MIKNSQIIFLFVYMLWNNLGFAQKNDFEFPARLHQNFPQAKHFEELINKYKPALSPVPMKGFSGGDEYPDEYMEDICFVFNISKERFRFRVIFTFFQNQKEAEKFASAYYPNPLEKIWIIRQNAVIGIFNIFSDEELHAAKEILAFFGKE